jgi:hypothetical protein
MIVFGDRVFNYRLYLSERAKRNKDPGVSYFVSKWIVPLGFVVAGSITCLVGVIRLLEPS